jgi:hypothetical protein
MTPPEPLWSDTDIANDAKRASSNPTIQATIRSCLLFIRSGYEAERAAHLARIAELEAQVEWKPLADAWYGDNEHTWVIAQNGANIQAWLNSDVQDVSEILLPDALRLCRRVATQEHTP